MTLRKPSLGCLLCLLISALADVSASANDLSTWTTERVLAGIVSVNGGMQAIDQVRDLRVLGEIQVDGQTAEFILLKRRPDRLRVGIYFSRSSEETAFDGRRAWKRLQSRSQSVTWILSEAELAAEHLDLDFDGPMIGEPLPGTTVELIGVERINRVDYFRMQVIDGRSRSVHYIDSRTFRELKKEVFALSDPDKLVLTSYSDEYRNYNPVWVAHQVRQVTADGSERMLKLHSVEFNIGILERAFQVPEDALPQRPEL